MKKKATKKKKTPNRITEIRWIYANDSLGRQLSDLKCQLNDLKSNIDAVVYYYNRGIFKENNNG